MAACALALSACTDYNDQFEGLAELLEIKDIKALEYTLTDADYASMASSASAMTKDADLQTALKAAGTAKQFKDTDEAHELVPCFFAWTSGSFFTLSDTSTIKLTYNVAETEEGETVITDQFERANGVWKYNPSVVITLNPTRNDPFVTPYYQAVVDWVWEHVDEPSGVAYKSGNGYLDTYGTADYYTGCSAYYNNVEMRPGTLRSKAPKVDSYQGADLVAAGIAFAGDCYSSLSDKEVSDLATKRLCYVMGQVLSKMHADAAPVEGIEVTYTVNLVIFLGGTSPKSPTHSLVYKVVGPAEFEFVGIKEI